MKILQWLLGNHRPNISNIIHCPADRLKEFDIKLYEATNERQEIERRFEHLQPSGTLIADAIGGRVNREE